MFLISAFSVYFSGFILPLNRFLFLFPSLFFGEGGGGSFSDLSFFVMENKILALSLGEIGRAHV